MLIKLDERDRPDNMRLGRNVNHDPRSRAYAIKSWAAAAVTTRHERLIPVLDQGNVGACTGHALTGALGSTGLVAPTLHALDQDDADPAEVLTAAFALERYKRATAIDPFAGVYPPDDTGSDGLSVCKAAQFDGLIAGYEHAMSVDAMVTGLQSNAGIAGVSWYSSFDYPTEGVLSLLPNARVLGGHEFHVLNVDMARQWFECVNSWGPGWGDRGRFFVPFPIMERLLREDGDATFPVPASQTPPLPTPTITRKFNTEDAAYLDFWASKGWIKGFTARGAREAWKRGR